MKTARWIWTLACLSATIFLIFTALTKWHKVEIVSVPLENEFDAVKIIDFDYAFEKWAAFGGAGGQGAAVLWMDRKTFLNEIKPGERIYASAKREGPNTASKIYIAGIENRNMLFGYKKIYVPPNNNANWRIYDQTQEIIVFKFNNSAEIVFLIMAAIISCAIVIVIGNHLMSKL